MPKFLISADQAKKLFDKGGDIRLFIYPASVSSSHMIMGTSRIAPKEVIKRHIHPYSEECFYVVQGEGILHLEDNERVLFSAGDAVFIPKGLIHSIENCGVEEVFVVFASSPLAPKSEEGHKNLPDETQSGGKDGKNHS